MEYSQHEKILFDVNVWGKQALQRAQILLRLLRTQKGFEQQWKYTISLSAPTGVRDLHFATGSQYRERVMFLINAYVADYIAKQLNFDYIIYMSYSIDFRRKVIFTMEEEELSIRETAKQFRIGSASVSRWINQ
ncbi:IS630 transposase-related protein, partial [Arsenophonus endosymbiont of Bemisia tabaci]|uniref:phage neck terminator protein n=1 Tax=Arsenophonus endosymbiont of Bemisia tabaci TaxID=536059 RepID=UPI001EE30AC9